MNYYLDKYVVEEQLKDLSKKLKSENKKIVLASGKFDILHGGHIEYLEKSKKLGDVLCVSLNNDNYFNSTFRPFLSQRDRVSIICSLSFVDYVVVFYEEDPCKIIDKLKPDIFAKGPDYSYDILKEKDVLEKNKIKFVSVGNKINNSTEIAERIFKWQLRNLLNF